MSSTTVWYIAMCLINQNVLYTGLFIYSHLPHLKGISKYMTIKGISKCISTIILNNSVLRTSIHPLISIGVWHVIVWRGIYFWHFFKWLKKSICLKQNNHMNNTFFKFTTYVFFSRIYNMAECVFFTFYFITLYLHLYVCVCMYQYLLWRTTFWNWLNVLETKAVYSVYILLNYQFSSLYKRINEIFYSLVFF